MLCSAKMYSAPLKMARSSAIKKESAQLHMAGI